MLRYLPALQLVHVALLLAPSAALQVPEGHGVKTMLVSAPASSQYPPAVQSVHWVCPGTSVYLPAGHAAQALAPSVRPKRPVLQSMQLPLLDAPVEGRYLPDGQPIGTDVPAGQKWPLQQGSSHVGDVRLLALPT